MDTSKVVSQAQGLRQRLSTTSCHNPFINYSTALPHTLYETLKLLLGGVLLLPIRIVVLLLVGAISWLVARASQLGRTPEELEQPPSPWRRLLVQPIPYLLRAAMFACGFYWIPVKGRPAPSTEAPLVVCNHRSFLDPMYMFYALGGPIGVAKAGVIDIPIAGPIARCLQPILVHREDKAKARQAGEAIITRARSRAWPHILIFPEGTCTNGTALIAFRIGAFATGVPVQPVVLRYPHVHFDPSWVGEPSLLYLVVRTLCQFANFMEVEYLPVYKPSEEEQHNALLYANNVRQVMADALRVRVTEHSYEDVVLLHEAAKIRLPEEKGLIEANSLRSYFSEALDLKSLTKELQRFNQMDTDHSGTLSYDEFCTATKVKDSPLMREVFDLMDLDQTGELDFREYIIGRAFASKYLSDEQTLRLAFDAFDTSGNGLIEREEVETVLRKISLDVRPEDVDALYASAAGDSNGQLDFESFSAYMKSHPEYMSLFVKYRVKQASDAVKALTADIVDVDKKQA